MCGGDGDCDDDGDGDDNEKICGRPAEVWLLLVVVVCQGDGKGVLTRGGCWDNSEIPFREITEGGLLTTTTSGDSTAMVVLMVSLPLVVMVSMGDGSDSSLLLPQLLSPLLLPLPLPTTLSLDDARKGDSPRGAAVASSSNRTDLPLSFKPKPPRSPQPRSRLLIRSNDRRLSNIWRL